MTMWYLIPTGLAVFFSLTKPRILLRCKAECCPESMSTAMGQILSESQSTVSEGNESKHLPTRLDPISSDSQPGGQLLAIWTLLLVGKDTESVQDRRSNHEVLGVSDGESARCELQKFFVLDPGDVRISLSLKIGRAHV